MPLSDNVQKHEVGRHREQLQNLSFWSWVFDTRGNLVCPVNLLPIAVFHSPPKRQQLLLERERPAILNAFAGEQGHVASHNAAFHSVKRHRLAELQLHARAGQKPARRFDKGPARRDIDNVRRPARPYTPTRDLRVIERQHPRPCPAF
jgi:hypothetical protein